MLFTTAPLSNPLEVTGHITADVFLASSAVDTDVVVRLCDVYPGGKSYNMAEGMLRLRYRDGFQNPRRLTPGDVTEARVDCWSTSLVFNRGHRIRVQLTSSNSPRFDVNPGTGKPWRMGDPQIKQINRIEVDRAPVLHCAAPYRGSEILTWRFEAQRGCREYRHRYSSSRAPVGSGVPRFRAPGTRHSCRFFPFSALPVQLSHGLRSLLTFSWLVDL